MEIQQYLFYFPVASIIFGLTIAASLLAFRNHELLRKLMLNPFEFIHGKKYYQVITSGFIHADIQHLLFNMLSFYFFAFPLEGLMVQAAGVIGHLYFGLVYIISMVLADTYTIIKQKDNPSYFSLGASGAVTAVIFSAILFEPMNKIYLMFIPIGIPAPIFAVLYVGYSIYAAKQMRGNINHEAHLGGAFSGLILTILLFQGILHHFIRAIHF